MKRLLAVLTLLFCGACAGEPAANPNLLGDSSLAAWEFVTASTTDLTAVCRPAADGAFTITGQPVGFLATKASYENYRLHVEWRWPVNAAKNSNSGVLLHVVSGPANGTAWPECFQLQLKPTRAGDLLPMHGAQFAEKLSTPPGAKTPQLDRAAASSEHALGEWNTCDIICRGDTIEVFVNGTPQNRVTRCAPFAGRVGIQLEGTPFELRQVRLTPL